MTDFQHLASTITEVTSKLDEALRSATPNLLAAQADLDSEAVMAASNLMANVRAAAVYLEALNAELDAAVDLTETPHEREIIETIRRNAEATTRAAILAEPDESDYGLLVPGQRLMDLWSSDTE